MKKNILLTGGTGMIGTFLIALLQEKGYGISILTRKKKKNTASIKYYTWDVASQKVDSNCLDHVEGIIHLAGENVASGRWTATRKNAILESRTVSTALLFKLLSEEEHSVKSFISASATGIYGSQTTEVNFTEDMSAAEDFLANICKQWEASVAKISDLGIRTVALRTGIVLSSKGSALQKMLLPFQLGMGSPIASGSQYMPWIHIDDLCRMYLHALETSNVKGAYNAVSGEAITNQQFSKILAKTLKRPFFMPKIPSFLLQLIFGEMSIILTSGSQVSSQKIRDAGFEFNYEKLGPTLRNLLG
ncbi:MAG: TIGR01777 family oxidoreductase [Flavicella sp.]